MVKSTLSKAEQIKMALLRNPKADPKILNQLKDLAQVTKDKNQTTVLEAENQKSFIEKQKNTLRKQLEKRAIEQGIAHKNLKDIETNLIFPLDSREKEISKEKKHGLFEMELIYMPNEEERDIRFVDSFFRANGKIIRYLFVKYCNLSVRKSKPDTFDKLNLGSQRMTCAELWKLLRDYNYGHYVSQEKIESLVRMVNVNIFKEKDEKLKSLDYEGFQIFLLNLAYFVYSKEPQGDLRHLPPSFALDSLVKHFRDEEKSKGNSTILFDDPEATIVADSSVLKEFNRKLEEDPEYLLPDGYKKVPDIRVKFEYKLCDSLSPALPESFRLCYEVLNDVFNEKLGFWLYEPLSVVKHIFLARPKILNPVSSKYNIESKINNSMINSASIINKQGSPLNKTFTVQPRKRVLEIAHKQPLSFNMKLQIAGFDPKYKYMAEEVGYLLEDLLMAVEKGLPEIPKYKKAVNKMLENKVRDESVEQEIKEKKEQKRKIRLQIIKKQLKEQGVLPENEEKRKELMKKRQEETLKAQFEDNKDAQKKKAQWEKRLKQHTEEKKKMDEEKKKKIQDEIQKTSEEQKKKEQEKIDKQKQFKEFNKKTKETLVI